MSRPRSAAVAALSLIAGCSDPSNRPTGPHIVSHTDPVQVVPNAAFPPEVKTDRANNNLDIIDFDGRLFLVFRTAPTHFASPDAAIYVLSSKDDTTWAFESKFVMGSDLREPRFFAWKGTLYLYFAELGKDPTAFEPGRMWRTQRIREGAWAEPVTTFEPDFIPWRIKLHEGRPLLIGYQGGENIYNFTGGEIRIFTLTTENGTDWVPLNPERPVVSRGGGSETDVEFDDGGNLFAVTRNEAGDETGFGSKICRAPKSDITDWTCVHDPKKYDSPQLIKNGSEIYLIARRNVTDTGNYDLGEDDLSYQEKLAQYLADYSGKPKRCAIWYFNRADLQIEWLMDLPSQGDTCFPTAIPRGRGRFLLYNYSSDIDGPDLSWFQAQLANTYIYSTILTFR